MFALEKRLNKFLISVVLGWWLRGITKTSSDSKISQSWSRQTSFSPFARLGTYIKEFLLLGISEMLKTPTSSKKNRNGSW